MQKIIAELRRRKVVKVAIAYLIVAWVLMQVADVMFRALRLPEWTVTLVAGLLIVGFPVALVLAWAFELTPEGMSRDRQTAEPGIGSSAGADATAARNIPLAASTSSGAAPAPPIAAPTPPMAAMTAPMATPTPPMVATIPPVAPPIAPLTPPEATAASRGRPSESIAPIVRDQRSVAVLPFVDMSPARDHEYFTDGLTEELLNTLVLVPGLRVPSRTSSFAFKGKDVDVATVAQRLQVTHVLEGSVRRAGDRIRITAQLIETHSDSHLWSETYDRTLDDIFAIQSDIARQIVGALRLRLRPQDAADATTTNARAYELYLTGLGFLRRFNPKSFGYAIDTFTRATTLDPAFAKAWAGLSYAHSHLAIYHSGGPVAVAASDEASRRAVELAPDLADAHTARAISFTAQERFEEAAAEFERAVVLNPQSFDAWYQYARTAWHQGDLPKAVKLYEKAMETDPDDYQSPLLVAALYRKLGQSEKEWESYRRGYERACRHLENYPDDARAYFLCTTPLVQMGQRERAYEWAERAVAIDPTNASTRYNVACFYVQVDEHERALDYLEGSITSRSWIENDPDLDPIRNHPRYKAYLASLEG